MWYGDIIVQSSIVKLFLSCNENRIWRPIQDYTNTPRRVQIEFTMVVGRFCPSNLKVKRAIDHGVDHNG
jgi:hypothetical protein